MQCALMHLTAGSLRKVARVLGESCRSIGRGKVAQAHIAILGYIKNAVHHGVHRVATPDQMANCNSDESLGVVPRDVGEDDEPWMDCPSRHEVTEVSGILRDEDEVLIDAAVQHTVVRVAQATVISRVEHDMAAVVIEDEGNVGGDALVEK